MYELAKAGKASHECIAAVRELLHQARWESSKLIPRTFGDRMDVDVGGAIHHSHDIDAMSMMEKARAIAYAMSKAKKLEALPASNAQASNAQVSNALPVAPLTTVDHQATVARLLWPTPPVAPAVPDLDDDVLIIE